ncbi:family 43 glycosylhydrolase [Foetidibacter luteolus]|uniref:family 43 glycosylhydrolase n=1 Tax=Foetidibacter luteolus TaxID=2608880 RepID=UPI00129A98D1|nr:family 43 glycosylhydrolase [Foetidibacter luteolus]
MKKLMLAFVTAFLVLSANAQFISSFHPEQEPTNGIQYFKPTGNLFVGDCIPFYHEGTYYLYWLLDSGHHSALGGLGGHQWTLSTSKDLKTWKHYPVVLGIDEDWEKSICTGSVVYHNKKFYAFYATRLIDANGNVNEQLSYAISDDGIHFNKQKPNPFYTSAPGYNKRNFRDPKVIVDNAGVFHLFVSSAKEPSETAEDGALVHLTSNDLKTWTVNEPLIYGQLDVPECPDYFLWKGWYYLVYGRGGSTFYLKSKKPYGPWEYPRYQALDEDWVNVAKTAEFTNGRRIVAGWIPNKKDSKDNGHEIFGGSIVLRELTQEQDGTLNTGWPAEALPATTATLTPTGTSGNHVTKTGADNYTINTPGGLDAVFFENIPTDCYISFEMETSGLVEDWGLYLRSNATGGEGYKLSFSAINREVRLANSSIKAVDGLDKKTKVQVVMKGDIIDVCIGGKRCIVNRLYERKGAALGLFAKHGKVTFSAFKIAPLQP